MALGRISSLEDQVVTLTASWRQSPGVGTQAVPHSPAPSAEAAAPATSYASLPAVHHSLHVHTKDPSAVSISETDSALPRPQRMVRSYSSPSLRGSFGSTSPFGSHDGLYAAVSAKPDLSRPVTESISPNDTANVSHVPSSLGLASSKEAKVRPVQSSAIPAATLPSEEDYPSPMPSSSAPAATTPSEEDYSSPVSSSPAPAATIPSKEDYPSPIPSSSAPAATIPSEEDYSSPVQSSPAPAATTASKEDYSSPVQSSPAPAATTASEEDYSSPVQSSPAPAATSPSEQDYSSPVQSSPAPAATSPSEQDYSSPVQSSPAPAAANSGKEAHVHYRFPTAATSSSSKGPYSSRISTVFSVAAGVSSSSSRPPPAAPAPGNTAPTRPTLSSLAQNSFFHNNAVGSARTPASSADARTPAIEEDADHDALSARRFSSQGTSSQGSQVVFLAKSLQPLMVIWPDHL